MDWMEWCHPQGAMHMASLDLALKGPWLALDGPILVLSA